MHHSQPDPDNPKITWKKPPLTGDKPSRRSGHTLTITGTNAYLFGGK